MKIFYKFYSLLFFCSLLLSLNSYLEGTSGSWISSPGGDWTVPINWATSPSGGIPNAPGDVAAFINKPSTTPIVSLGENITIGSLLLNNSTELVIDSTNDDTSLTFEGTSNQPIATIFVSKGTVTDIFPSYLIDSSVVSLQLLSPLEIYGTSNSALQILTDIQGSQPLTFSSSTSASATTGLLNLGGNNAYTGHTTIDNGTLLLSGVSGKIGPAIPGDLFVNANSNVVARPTSTYSIFSDTSNVTVTGPNTKFFIATSSPLQFNSLTMDQSVIFSEITGQEATVTLLSSTNALTIGAANFLVTNLNLPNGGAIAYPAGVSDGLALIAGNTTDEITINLGGHAVDINIPAPIRPEFDMEFVNALFINGSLDKTGSGNLLLQGGSLPTGGLTIDGGKVLIGTNSAVVESTSGPTPIQINAQGILGGLGTLGSGTANVTNAGLVTPGTQAVIDTFTINGNYTQASGGQLIIRVSSSASDKLVVNTGGVILGGTLVFDALPNSGLAPGDRILVLDNSGGTGITGQFSNLVATLPPNLTAVIDYSDPFRVFVDILGPNCPPCPPCDSCCPPCPPCPTLLPPSNLHAKVVKHHSDSR